MKYEPEESELEFDGMVNFSELFPDALISVSRAARLYSDDPYGGRMPEFCPYAPDVSPLPMLKSPTSSKPTHLITPGCAQRA